MTHAHTSARAHTHTCTQSIIGAYDADDLKSFSSRPATTQVLNRVDING